MTTIAGHADRGSEDFLRIEKKMVGARGFEPPTPRSRTETKNEISGPIRKQFVTA